ncbi:MAG: M50 family metallopeptidase [Mycobacteriales bacterium]
MSDHERTIDAWAGVGRALVTLAVSAYVGVSIIGDRISAGSAAAIYILVVVLSILLHEIAHALVAMAVGAEVTGMRFGFGPRLTPLSSPFDLRPLIVAAHVSYRPPRAARRWQLVAVSAAGLAVHLVLVAVALSLGGGAWPAWRIALLVANAYALLGNALPMLGGFTTTSGGPNDGATIALLLRHRGPFLSNADPDLVDVLDALDRGGSPAAVAVLDGLDRKDLPLLRMRAAEIALAAGRWPDARTLVRGGVDASRPWKGAHVFAEAEAMDMLTAGTAAPERVAAADEAVVAAMQALPDGVATRERAAVTHTLALVRLLEDRWDEAAGLCAWAGPGTATPAERAAVLATHGWALLRQGRRSEAERMLAQAMALSNGPLPRALARVLAATPAST